MTKTPHAEKIKSRGSLKKNFNGLIELQALVPYSFDRVLKIFFEYPLLYFSKTDIVLIHVYVTIIVTVDIDVVFDCPMRCWIVC